MVAQKAAMGTAAHDVQNKNGESTNHHQRQNDTQDQTLMRMLIAIMKEVKVAFSDLNQSVQNQTCELKDRISQLEKATQTGTKELTLQMTEMTIAMKKQNNQWQDQSKKELLTVDYMDRLLKQQRLEKAFANRDNDNYFMNYCFVFFEQNSCKKDRTLIKSILEAFVHGKSLRLGKYRSKSEEELINCLPIGATQESEKHAKFEESERDFRDQLSDRLFELLGVRPRFTHDDTGYTIYYS